MSVDLPTDSTYGCDVSDDVDEGAFLDMAGHETSLRFRPLPTKPCLFVYTDAVLHNAEADPDEEGSDDEWSAKAKQEGIRVGSQHDALVCVVAQDDVKKTMWSTSGSEASACGDALDLAEYKRAVWCQVVIGGEVPPDKWKEEHHYRL